ncbi:MAG: SiaB family protein kinase [Bacteroidales bacterium]|nr:SiaB family protein kinase [Bacteroidales bacterium]
MTTNHKSNNDIFYQVFRLFTDHYIQLVYHGKLTSEKADALINIFEHLLSQNEARLKIQKRAFYILVEALQNVIRHQAKPESSQIRSKGTLTFQYMDGQFLFTLKNLIETTHIKALKEKIDTLNRMSREELNKHYKKILKNDVLSEKGGAGLGLIEIARKSENLLQYDFREVDEKYSYFYLNMLVTDQQRSLPENGISLTKQLHRLLQNSGNWLILHEEYYTRLSPKQHLSLHKLAEKKFQTEKFQKFLSLLSRIPELCLSSTNLSSGQMRMPCLIFFVLEESTLSVYTGSVLPVSSPFDLNFFSNYFMHKTVPESFVGNTGREGNEGKLLQELPSLLSSPPRIIIREVSQSEKFILIKFSFA